MSSKTVVVTSAAWLVILGFFFSLREASSSSEAVYGSMSSGLVTSGDVEETLSTSEKKEDPDRPFWMLKYNFLEQASEVEVNNRICFVHVGKTAGSTVACSLGFPYNHCSYGAQQDSSSLRLPSRETIRGTGKDVLEEFIPPHSLLSHYTTSVMHRSYDTCKTDHTPTYLFVVRDPLDRLRSWFEYEHPTKDSNVHSDSYQRKKPLYVDCGYDTFNQLGQGLQKHNETSCSRRAWKAVTGLVGYNAHNMYNYEYYYHRAMKHAPEDRKILVIRTEHLEQDWSSIEANFLDNPAGALPDDFSFSKKNRSPKKVEDFDLDEESQKELCYALCQEIQVYKRILQQAENLNKADYAQSMHELARNCPKEASLANCW